MKPGQCGQGRKRTLEDAAHLRPAVWAARIDHFRHSVHRCPALALPTLEGADLLFYKRVVHGRLLYVSLGVLVCA
jgi:hypothetical protein